jgi:hypothetical protein
MLGGVFALVPAGLLLYAGIKHSSGVPAFARAIRSQNVWPPRLARPIALAATASEFAVGACGLFAAIALAADGRFATAAFGATACIYAAYAAYIGLLLSRGAKVPCACGGNAPVGWVTFTRAVVLAGAAAAAPVADASALGAGAAPDEVALTVLGSVAFGVLLWTLPSALQIVPVINVGPGRGPSAAGSSLTGSER